MTNEPLTDDIQKMKTLRRMISDSADSDLILSSTFRIQAVSFITT